MIQTQWPGLGPTYPFPPGGATTGAGNGTSAPFGITSADGVSPTWWAPSPGGIDGGASLGGWGILQMIFSLLQQLAAPFISGTAGGPVHQHPRERFTDVDISSTGDPHLALTGTRQTAHGGQTVDKHFDSMTSHDDLVDTRAIPGGYRVSTVVTQPGANGVTWNRSATVHANGGRESVTMSNDGSIAITDGDDAIALEKGHSVTLSGGETVTQNADGSLVVAAANGNGGTISTTLRSNGTGVDVTTHAHEMAVGGDVVEHGV